MSVILDRQAIVITGDCGAEEAETLMSLMQANPDAPVDIGAAGSLHTAVWQVMLVLRPRLVGEPADAFLRRWIVPLITRADPHRTTT